MPANALIASFHYLFVSPLKNFINKFKKNFSPLMCFLKLLLLFKLILLVCLTDCVERDDAGPSEASKYGG